MGKTSISLAPYSSFGIDMGVSGSCHVSRLVTFVAFSDAISLFCWKILKVFTILSLSEGVAIPSARACVALGSTLCRPFACSSSSISKSASRMPTLRCANELLGLGWSLSEGRVSCACGCSRKSSIASPTLSLVISRLSLALGVLASCPFGRNRRLTSRAIAALSTCLSLLDSELHTAQRACMWDCESMMLWASSREVARLSGDERLSRFKRRNMAQSCWCNIHRCTGIAASGPEERRPMVLPGRKCEGRLARKTSYLAIRWSRACACPLDCSSCRTSRRVLRNSIDSRANVAISIVWTEYDIVVNSERGRSAICPWSFILKPEGQRSSSLTCKGRRVLKCEGWML